MKWEVVIGIEVHVQLNTASKIFSGASTAFGAEPNTQASAVELALPGVLPVLNRAVVDKAIRLGLALDANINQKNVFARKNYFYPDLPKGYQISQMDLPIVEHGKLKILVGDQEKVIGVTRAHMEEDAGKSLHEDFQGLSGIDLNRAGTPLLEVVSEPDMRSVDEALAYVKALYTLVTWLGICDGNMQEGSFRMDVNVSVRPEGQKEFGTRREIKNLNSFRFLEQAAKYEIQWQIDTLEDGGKVQQATVLFDPDTGETRMMRSKEDAHDYRYFPDPDLLPVRISDEQVARIKGEMPELPGAMQARFVDAYGVSAYDAALLTSSLAQAQYFEAVAKASGQGKLAANWINGEIAARLNRDGKDILDCPISAERLSGLIARIADNTLSSKLAKQVFDALWDSELSADAIIERDGLKQVSDVGAIEKMVEEAIAANPKAVEEFRAGKEKALNALAGQVMKASKGKANPAQVQDILRQKLS
ncbi:Asp-tRNA(Asn)/Glu-tRNA(Gln) amidotransferase subunit GatB [Chromobacterium violaceum]|uniref:Aspartyl/glutamyl-tRNA(Asn/Gln) amidotransferase subunit B n=1 Tax=Chromobacterium violaceum (strain ATCC 12472 / DSM 30191 / JCM 1249 / CCUG 213 / NBRC 12614 / NCIMB 9131 / NCTC 9757 / MK) TaxID=243365 RepID=GATB_CHRVO|nr:Asp-tRNA(Asn)/Glu-tRNA(Gln) amidotransferase subunit GatB [Chromobacterium violaceum]Q7NPY8.1 RecName: Full=Aspartyl/glutamyl-tRNA(Asn/Gln) amidotransferase subunit B; Short=Asp/Glu-ADT subunit B [Chromobacterium violaceum ATCC 12472]AAQ62013.1 Glu-tRNA(Gln) amidotransferase, subunit B [Chromobacterium violaceum ATCC 12472]SUX40775.1 Aspartyl/glutamyl-tRNA(Asn/Gln) amidotransferase subunit B [Chromobacterium violaceum]